MAAPLPSLARRHETDFRHQVTDGRLVEAEAGRERDVDRVLAAMLADMMGMCREAVGEIDAQPVGAKAPKRQRCLRPTPRTSSPRKNVVSRTPSSIA